MISVIMPVFRNANLVEYCLTLLCDNFPADAELIIVDDASGLETLEVLNRFKRARIVQHPANRGNTAAYNTGVAAAQGDLLIFVDSDVFVPPGALDELGQVLSADRQWGAVGSLLLYPSDYTIQHAGVAFDRWVVTHLFVGRKQDEISLRPLEERQAVTAALFATPRNVFERVGGFNETYRDGLEDIEYCLRCTEMGYRNALTSRFPALHIESATRGKHKEVRRTFNYSVFFSRWHGRFRPDLTDYLRASAQGVLGCYDSHGYPLLTLNFCTTPNWLDLAEVLKEFGVRLGAAHNFSGTLLESDSIELFRAVPMAFHRQPAPLLFIVDHFEQLKRNRLWFCRRSMNDLVVDRHANVLTGQKFGFGGERP